MVGLQGFPHFAWGYWDRKALKGQTRASDGSGERLGDFPGFIFQRNLDLLMVMYNCMYTSMDCHQIEGEHDWNILTHRPQMYSCSPFSKKARDWDICHFRNFEAQAEWEWWPTRMVSHLLMSFEALRVHWCPISQPHLFLPWLLGDVGRYCTHICIYIYVHIHTSRTS